MEYLAAKVADAAAGSQTNYQQPAKPQKAELPQHHIKFSVIGCSANFLSE